MSITDGQSVNAAVTNAAFVSKTANSTVTGAITLAKVSGSGATVADVQAAINDGISHAAATAAHGATGAVVGTTNTQTLTNKDYDGGTASNTSRITVPKNTKANLDALTRKVATVVYGTDTNKLYADNGTVLKAIGGSFEIVANAAQTNATTLTPGANSAQVLQISGNGGAVTLTDLGITNAQDGDQLVLAGTSDTNTVTIVPATNTVMNGGVTLGDGNMITFLYFNSKYREQSRNC